MTIGFCLLKPTDISLRVFSLVQLYTAIYLRRDLFDTVAGGMGREGVSPELLESLIHQWFQRPMMRLSGDSVKVHYDSAISLAIAAKLPQSPQTIAVWLRDAVLAATAAPPIAPAPDAVCLQVELRITDQGWLRWEWSALALSIWLDHAVRSIPQWPLTPVTFAAVGQRSAALQSPELWYCFHAYARCSQWLSQRSPQGITQPMGAVPQEPQRESQRESQWEPLEQSVLLNLMAVIDQLAEQRLPPQVDFYMQAAIATAQAFERIDRQGIGQPIDILPPFRLGLVMLIKQLLHQLLHQGLGQQTAEKI